MSTSYFVTGASRGIGQEIVSQLVSKPDTSIVFAGVRNPSSASQELRSHPKVKVVQLDVLNEDHTAAAVQTVKASNNGALDVLILNAGAATTTPMTQAPVEELREYIELNAISTHRLVTAFLPLLRAGREKKIIAIGTSAGSFGLSQPLAKQGYPLGAYGVSKAAMHFLIMLYAAELQNEGFKCISFHPGVVDTEGLKGVLDSAPPGSKEKLERAGMTVISKQQSVEGMLKTAARIDAEMNGNLYLWDGSKLPF